MAALLLAYTAWQRGWERGIEVTADLLSLVLLATVLTVTTAVDEILDAITRGLRPSAGSASIPNVSRWPSR